MYRRQWNRRARPQVRTIAAKFAGKCACCGAPIKVGETVQYYPVGTIMGVSEGRIAHVGGLDGNSVRCFTELRKQTVDAGANDYAGDGLDARYEDDCRDICGP